MIICDSSKCKKKILEGNYYILIKRVIEGIYSFDIMVCNFECMADFAKENLSNNIY